MEKKSTLWKLNFSQGKSTINNIEYVRENNIVGMESAGESVTILHSPVWGGNI